MTHTTGRIVDHQGMEVLRTDECWEAIARSPVGRIAFVESGEPVILPVNHGVHGHRIAIRTAHGTILDEALRERPVAFEVDGFDPVTRTGWSVLVRGQATLAPDQIIDLTLDPWADAVDRDQFIEILAEEVTGRRIVRAPTTGG